MPVITAGTRALVSPAIFQSLIAAGVLKRIAWDGPVGNQWPVWGIEREEDDLIEVEFTEADNL